MKSLSRSLVSVLTVTSLSVAGCGTDSTSTTSSAAPGSSTGLVVFAAASLKAAFTTLGDTFESENPDTEVTFNFTGSSDLVTQLDGGAPADVFAAADTLNMTKASESGLLGALPVNFASNTLIIVTPADNPAGISSFADLAKDAVSEVICAAEVPCGAATKKIETATGITLSPVSEEQSVIDVLNKVESGEADAGLVYVTDAANAGNKVRAIPFPESRSAVNTYSLTVLKASTNPRHAAAFVELVTGPEGQAVLRAAGFAPAL